MSEKNLSLNIKPRSLSESVAIWSAIPPAYETTPSTVETGIHVHVRRGIDGDKYIDTTISEVTIVLEGEKIVISSEMAFAYRICRVLGFTMRSLSCPQCGTAHFDSGQLLLKPHNIHLCSVCRCKFTDSVCALSNPLASLQNRIVGGTSSLKNSEKHLDIKSGEYLGGIRVWGTAQAIIWTSPNDEEYGLHVHAYNRKNKKIVDDTYGLVTLDGIELPIRPIELYTIQRELFKLRNSISSLKCPYCENLHFDDGLYAIKLHKTHLCEVCGHKFQALNKNKSISNPTPMILNKLNVTRETREKRF